MVQAVLYEAIAVAVVAPVLAWVYAHPAMSSLALSATMSGVALAWNVAFNAVYERWESTQRPHGRPWGRRIVHGLAFEGGLTFLLVPIMSVWLHVSIGQALVADAGLLAFFFVYTVVYTWAFDRAFGLPASARESSAA